MKTSGKTSDSFQPKNILCPIDFSDLSDLALKYAAAGAQAFGATLVVFHAQRFELPPYFTRGQIEELTRQHRAEQAKAKEFVRLHVRKVLGHQANNLSIKFDLSDAPPVDAVLNSAKRSRAELIVMGTHGRGGAKRIWLGSVLENVIRQAGVPVFAVRQKQHEFVDTSNPLNTPKLESILCPVNFSRAALAGLDHAISLAKRFNARLIPVCIAEPGDTRGTSELREELASRLEEGGAGGCNVETQTRRGEAGKEIVNLVTRTRADLVVLGARPRNPLHAWLWGDTTEVVLRRAPVPVLVVPAVGKRS